MPENTLPTDTLLVDANYARFLTEFGQEFTVEQVWPNGLPLRRGPLRACYRTASRSVVSDGRWVYCEGIACSLKLRLLLPHAWVYDVHTKKAYDPTWNDGSVYFGLPILASYLRNARREREADDVANYLLRDWPNTRISPDQWRDQRVAVNSADTRARRATIQLLGERVRRTMAGEQVHQLVFG
jgi:hypothetical protein